MIAADLAPGDAIAALDVTDEAAVAAVDGIVAEHGHLDLAANVAGFPGVYAELADSSTDVWRHTMAVNLDGAYFCVRAELRAMLAAGVDAPDAPQPTGRSIVDVASSAARMGVPGLAAYAASKHGLLGLTRTAAMEVGRKGIRVNAVCPGTVRTPMLAGFVGGDQELARGHGPPHTDGPAGRPGRESPRPSCGCCPTRPATSPAPRSTPTAASPAIASASRRGPTRARRGHARTPFAEREGEVEEVEPVAPDSAICRRPPRRFRTPRSRPAGPTTMTSLRSVSTVEPLTATLCHRTSKPEPYLASPASCLATALRPRAAGNGTFW